jgi:hypothetical protein
MNEYTQRICNSGAPGPEYYRCCELVTLLSKLLLALIVALVFVTVSLWA